MVLTYVRNEADRSTDGDERHRVETGTTRVSSLSADDTDVRQTRTPADREHREKRSEPSTTERNDRAIYRHNTDPPSVY
ncbi:hypothetical protein D8S78_22255 [Natrialba swarupiae]|nr:hypothetical protein [Natrialba swarupiae]